MNAGWDVVVDADIRKFFDSVKHKIIIKKLREVTDDEMVIELVAKYLKLGHYAHDKSESDFWEKRRKNAEKESGLFNSIARSRHFNVAGETINIDEVVRVLWHDNDDNEKATLVMRDGHKVRTYSEPEYNVVVGMFGSNRSDRVIPLV